MGTVRRQRQVCRLCSIIAVDHGVLREAAEVLQDEFGPEDYKSSPVSWDYSKMYREEMGRSLKWVIVSYKWPEWPQDIWKWKLITNDLESEFARLDGTRKANLDPGYTDGVKVVLASTKNYANRIYIRDGIYGDLTLGYNYDQATFEGHQYTFPEYKTAHAIDAFNEIRERFLRRPLQGKKQKPD